jgi:hypothetical protein
MKLEETVWMVCWETSTSTVIGQQDWMKHDELFDACVAFCQGKGDWTDLSY